MTKSHVSLEQHICPVCGVTHDTGAVLLNRRLRNTLEHHTTTGVSMCPEHQKLFDDGYIALIEIDPSKSGRPNPNGNLMPEDAHRTGVIVHLRRKVFEDIFDGSRAVDKDDKPLPMVFIDPEVTAVLQKMTGQGE